MPDGDTQTKMFYASEIQEMSNRCARFANRLEDLSAAAAESLRRASGELDEAVKMLGVSR